MALYDLAKSLGIERLLKRHLPLYRLSRNVIGRLDIFLPLEPDFRAFRHFAPGSGIFLDVGANDGISARSFRVFNRVTPIVSIEANPLHRAALQRLKARLPRFDYFLIGAGESESRFVLQTAVLNGFAFDSYSAADARQIRQRLHQELGIAPDDPRLAFETAEVEVRPLDLFGFPTDFIKIDVEGAEPAVLRGLARTIAAHRPVIMIEYNETNFATVRDFLAPFGFLPYLFDRKADRFRPFSGQQTDNVFFMTEEKSRTAPLARSSDRQSG
jgi:FkbM family methyltransferase